MSMRPETMAKYASRAWGVLVYAASTGAILSCTEVSKAIGFGNCRQMGRVLAPIDDYCYCRNSQLPSLSSVVKKGDGYTPRLKTAKHDRQWIFNRPYHWKHPGFDILLEHAKRV